MGQKAVRAGNGRLSWLPLMTLCGFHRSLLTHTETQPLIIIIIRTLLPLSFSVSIEKAKFS